MKGYNMTLLIRPALGLLQGCILYLIMFHTQLSHAAMIAAAIILTFPLFALQVKLPQKNSLILGLSILLPMSLVYGFAAYYLIEALASSVSYVTSLLAIQCGVSIFVLFIFYCVAVEERRFLFPYATLFSEAWQVILKLFLSKILVMVTWGLFILAGLLFQLLNINFVHDIVVSNAFRLVMLPCFFGISLTILLQYEEILTKLRNILLAFCRFLYPIFIVISLSFMVVIPLANKKFDELWPVTIFLSLLNIILFNGIFQGGLTKPPYARWFCGLLYANMILATLYSLYVLKFPWLALSTEDYKPDQFLLLLNLALLALYNLSYSIAIFASKKPWLSSVKLSNTALALLIALLYLCLALPWFHIG